VTRASASVGLVRGLTLAAATSVVVGTVIGTGVFIKPRVMMCNVWGPAALLLIWVVTGLMTMVGALAYAELAAMMPTAGGQYVFLREGLSPLVGFLFGWTVFTVIQTGTIAAVAVAFGKFLGVLVPAVSPDVFLSFGKVPMPGGVIEVGLSNQRLVALAIVVLLTALNARGVTLGAKVQTVFAVAKIGGLLALVVLGLTIFRRPEIAAVNRSAFTGTADWTWAVIPIFGAAMVGSLFSADAWNNVTYAAAEVRNPRRNLPLALGLGTGIVTVLYVLANIAYLNLLPFVGDPNGADVLSRGMQYAAEDRVATAAAGVMFGQVGGAVMAVAVMLSTFGAANGLVLAGPRVYYAMARDRLFFEPAARLHPEYRTPTFGLWAQAAWAMVLCLSGTYGNLLDYVIFASLLFYFVTTLALFVLRARRPELPRPYRLWGYPFVPIAFILAHLWIVWGSLTHKTAESLWGFAIVAAGIPAYLYWRYRGEKV